MFKEPIRDALRHSFIFSIECGPLLIAFFFISFPFRLSGFNNLLGIFFLNNIGSFFFFFGERENIYYQWLRGDYLI